jgi:arylsulfatase A-like enzyme
VPPAAQYWEHTGNCAVRRGRWKLVREYPGAWELYDLTVDRAETRDVAVHHPAMVAELSGSFDAWADRVGVVAWERTLAWYRQRGGTEEDAAG